ncbi:DnaJ domain-containing protein [bacterium]|nr:DnaJ domain-containing protein [candidate division CSSED10-310 bacterium]
MIYRIQQGTLEGRILPFILFDLYTNKSIGMLSLRREAFRKFIFFERGDISFAQSSVPQEQLGRQMLAGGAINDEQYGILHDLVREGGWKNPRISELDFILESTIEWWMKSLIREIVMSVLTWDQGEYRFFNGKKAPQTCPIVHLNTAKILFSTIRRIHNPHILIRWLDDLDAKPRIDHTALMKDNSGLNFTPQEGFFASRIDGSLTFRQILTLTGEQRLEMLQFFVAALITGIILVKERRKPILLATVGEPPGTEPPNSGTDEIRSDPDPVTLKTVTPSPEDSPEDVFLTEEELAELESLTRSRELVRELDEVSVQEMLRREKVSLDAHIAYLRDGRFVDSIEEGSLDISELRKLEKRKPGEIDESRLTLLIGGEEMDAESSLIGESAIRDIFSSSDADDQWNKWITTKVDESDEDYLQVWEKSWQSWEEQTKEITRLRDEQKEIETRIDETKSDLLKQDLKKRYEQKQREIERLITLKKREILNTYRRAQIQNYYDVLRVNPDASPEDIRTAYFKWLNEYQPDRRYLKDFEALSGHLETLVEKLHEAYELLSNEEDRASYDANLERRREAMEALEKKKKVLAQNHLISSREAQKRADMMMAMRFVRASISLDPRNAEYYSEMARILSGNPIWLQEAMRFFHRAYHLDPQNPELLVDVARLAVKMEFKKFAEKVLTQAMLLSPGNKAVIRLMSELTRIK